MPTWRCPYCGTPQAETARCWVCHRSTTSCFTCRHFRRGVTAQLGFCGRDRLHAVLTGREQRDCWERPAAMTATGAAKADDGDDSVEPSTDEMPPAYGLWAQPAPTQTETRS